MSNPDNEQTSPMNVSFHPAQQPDPMKPSTNPPPAMYGASPSVPYQSQPYAGPHGAVLMQPEQANLMTNVQSVKERDYLCYSIFTLLFCCPCLGIASLIYSIKTQGANQQRDIASARRYSRLALTLAHTALGLGITWIVLTIIITIVFSNVIVKQASSVHPNYNYSW